MNLPKADWPSSLTDSELEELDYYLRAHVDEGDLLLDGVHGLLSALTVGPIRILPEEWLPEVLHEPFADEAEGQRVLSLLGKLGDAIAVELEMDAYEPILGEITTVDGPALSAGGWCDGFSRGIDLCAGLWEKRLAGDPELMDILGPIIALAVDEGVLRADAQFEPLSAEEYEHYLDCMPAALNAITYYWREHPATEAERATVTPASPPWRGGHWVH